MAESPRTFRAFRVDPCLVSEDRAHFWEQSDLAVGLDPWWAGVSYVLDYHRFLKIVEFYFYGFLFFPTKIQINHNQPF